MPRPKNKPPKKTISASQPAKRAKPAPAKSASIRAQPQKALAAAPRAENGLALVRRSILAFDVTSPAFAAAHKKSADAFRKPDADRDGSHYAEALFGDKDSQKWWT